MASNEILSLALALTALAVFGGALGWASWMEITFETRERQMSVQHHHPTHHHTTHQRKPRQFWLREENILGALAAFLTFAAIYACSWWRQHFLSVCRRAEHGRCHLYFHMDGHASQTLKMNVSQAIRERRAVRDFNPEPVSAGALHRLISAASWAPSAMNEQPWRFTIVTDRAVLDEISNRAKCWMLKNLPTMVRRAHFRDVLAEPNFHIFYNAPCLVIISATSTGPWMSEDVALAAQNLMLMATDLGLGTCWIGFAQGWLNTAEGREILDLPQKARL